MPIDIHASMQDADDIEAGFGRAKENEVLADRVFEIALAHIGAATDLDAAGERFDGGDQIVVIAIRLLKRPSLERVEPDVFQVGDGER